METITKQQFESLIVGDTLKNENSTLLVEAKFANSVLVLTNEEYACIYSLKELQDIEFSINQPIQHNCGFPFGNYSDREVVVRVSDTSIENCEVYIQYTRLISVNEKGFKDHNDDTWKFAVLVSNNVDLVK